jgi:site-specific DNA recombinase
VKRAAIYIRVSTKDQARRDGSPEGYSLPTQRLSCRTKAEALGAVIVEEYIDKDSGTRTDKRPAMLALLERVRTQHDIDQVIVFKLDRWARNATDDLLNDRILEASGAELVSCFESIDRTNAGRLQHVFLAGVNEYHSRNMSDEIKRKTLIKIQNGGTHGVAPLGYKNVGEGGRRYVVVDQDRAPLIVWLFEAYATGEWSVVALLHEVTGRGLRSRGGPNTMSKPLSIGQLHRILRSPYYKGTVVFNGVEYQGKHDHLVDDETWQRVQDVLASKANGEKQRTHHHYLKGTIWCGHCGSRLVIMYANGRGGRYPYYFCVGRQQKRTTCMLSYRPLAWVEEQIEAQYLFVSLVAEGLDRTSRAILDEVASQQNLLKAERQQRRTELRRLDEERTKLLHAHYAGAVPLDLLQQEQARIAHEISVAQSRLATASAEFERIEDTVQTATAKAQGIRAAYLEAEPLERRLINQAFFRKIWVTEDGVAGWDYNEPFATLLAAHGAKVHVIPHAMAPTAKKADRQPLNVISLHLRRKKAPVGASFRLGLKAEHLAERVGFEPTVPLAEDNALAGRPIRPLWHLSWVKHRRRHRGGPH